MAPPHRYLLIAAACCAITDSFVATRTQPPRAARLLAKSGKKKKKAAGIVIPESELPRVVDVLATARATITPTAEELVKIAARVDVSEVLALAASAAVARSKKTGAIEIRGNVTASVRQACVTTGAPVFSDVAEQFVVPVVVGEADEFDDDDDGDDEVVRSVDGKVELGELVLQFLCLAIDPYPRAVPVSSDAIASHGDRDDTQPEAFLEIG